jgi:tetratricopeptide (TPR) repeat protein
MSGTSNKYQSLWICLLLILVTFAVFRQLRYCEFIDYDDDKYIKKNPYVQSGLNLKSIEWAFTATRASNWHPVTWLSHILDCQFFGLNPKWHHLVNLLFHIINTLLLFWVLKDMTGAVWQSAFVAAAFALHPLHVESVAWVAERKDVLSTLFLLITMAAYVHYVRHSDIKWYMVTLLLFVSGLMAKPMLVTLPFVLLLLDYWPLERLNRHTIYEKAPFFVFSAISSVITFLAQQRGGAMTDADVLALRIRFANAVVSYLRYVGKMIWPSKLAVLYPYHIDRLLFLKAAAAVLVLLGVSILAIRLASRHRYLPVGWFWYLGTLVPVIGFIQVGSQTFADRYTYIPLTGLFIIVAWALPELLAGRRYRKVVLGVSAAIVLLVLSICTHLQLRYWRNSIALFEHTLKVTGDNDTIHYNLGDVFRLGGNPEKAIAHYRQAVKIKPDYIKAINNLGNILAEQGRFDEAVDYFNQGLHFAPNDVWLRYNLAVTFLSAGKADEAVNEFSYALQLAVAEKNEELAGLIREKLDLFRQPKP